MPLPPAAVAAAAAAAVVVVVVEQEEQEEERQRWRVAARQGPGRVIVRDGVNEVAVAERMAGTASSTSNAANLESTYLPSLY